MIKLLKNLLKDELTGTILFIIFCFFVIFLAIFFYSMDHWFNGNVDWAIAYFTGVIAFFTALSAIAIVLTAYWAKKSFWYTAQKDKTDRAVSYIERLNDSDIVGEMAHVTKIFNFKSPDNELFKEYDQIIKSGNPDKLQKFNEKFEKENTPKIRRVLILLESIGLLIKYDKIYFPIVYDTFHLLVEEVWPGIEIIIKTFQKTQPLAWSHVVYLKNEIDNYKLKNYDPHSLRS